MAGTFEQWRAHRNGHPEAWRASTRLLIKVVESRGVEVAKADGGAVSQESQPLPAQPEIEILPDIGAVLPSSEQQIESD